MADHLPAPGAGRAPDARGNPAAALNGAGTTAPLDETSGGLAAGQLAAEEAVIRAEIASLTDLRRGLPEPSAAVLAAARGQLLDRAARVGAAGPPVTSASATEPATTPAAGRQ